MSVLSLSYWESDVYWRQNNKHLAELAPQNGGKQLIMKKLRHCHPMYTSRRCQLRRDEFAPSTSAVAAAATVVRVCPHSPGDSARTRSVIKRRLFSWREKELIAVEAWELIRWDSAAGTNNHFISRCTSLTAVTRHRHNDSVGSLYFTNVSSSFIFFWKQPLRLLLTDSLETLP